MARDEFLLSLRTAAGMLSPRVDTDHPSTNGGAQEKTLHRADLWLSKGAVKGFDPDDFKDLDRETREALRRNVAAFLEIVSQVDPKGPATEAQVEAAIPPFRDVVSIVRTFMLDEWLREARGLIDQADHWAEAEGWPTKRYPWTLSESFLGTYQLDRLVFGVAGSQMALIPVGKAMANSQGSFDLAVMPAYESVAVARDRRGWFIRPLPGEDKSRRWSRSAFVETSEKLARMG